MALQHSITTPDGIAHDAAYRRYDSLHIQRSLSQPETIAQVYTYHSADTRTDAAQPVKRGAVNLDALATELGDCDAVTAYQSAKDALIAACYELEKAANPGEYEDAQ